MTPQDGIAMYKAGLAEGRAEKQKMLHEAWSTAHEATERNEKLRARVSELEAEVERLSAENTELKEGGTVYSELMAKLAAAQQKAADACSEMVQGSLVDPTMLTKPLDAAKRHAVNIGALRQSAVAEELYDG